MGLSTLQRTGTEQFYFSNETGSNPKIHLTFEKGKTFFICKIPPKASYQPDNSIISSLFEMSSPVIEVSCFESAKQQEDEPVLLSEKIKYILGTLNISKKTLCTILNITRPTLYSWLNNECEPERKNDKKVSEIYKLLGSFNLDMSVHYKYVEEKLSGESVSILELLKKTDSILNNTELKKLLKEAIKLTKLRKEKIESTSGTLNMISEARQELLMEDNINSL